jgi:hypothetical protein
MSDTPETDAFMTRIRGIDGDKYWVPVTTARRLERERDEARELAQQMSESNQALLADVRFYRSAWERFMAFLSKKEKP